MNNKKKEKIEEFQEIFEIVFRKLKQRNDIFPKTKYNLAEGHVFALVYISKKKTCTVSDITSYLGITSGGGTVVTDTLLNHNLINRIRSEKDRRVIQLSLTKEGESIVEQIIKQKAEAFSRLFDNLEANDIEEVINVFSKLNYTLS